MLLGWNSAEEVILNPCVESLGTCLVRDVPLLSCKGRSRTILVERQKQAVYLPKRILQ